MATTCYWSSVGFGVFCFAALRKNTPKPTAVSAYSLETTKMNKTIKTIAIILMLIPTIVNAQNQTKIDSLLIELENETIDTVKVKILNNLSWFNSRQAPKKTIEYATKAIELSRQTNFKRGEGIGLKNKGIGYYYIGNMDSALLCYKESYELFKKIKDIKNASDLLGQIAIMYDIYGDYKNALIYYDKCLKAKIELNDTLGKARVLQNIGILYYLQTKYDTALIYSRKSLDEYFKLDYKQGVASVYSNIGLVYKEQEKFDSALVYCQKSLQLSDELNDKSGKAFTLNYLAGIYLKQKFYDKTLDIYNKLIEIYTELENKQGIAAAKLNIGGLHTTLKEYPFAIKTMKEAFEIAIDVKDKALIGNIHMNLGYAYLQNKQFDKSKKHLNEAYQINKELENKSNLAQILIHQGNLDNQISNSKSAQQKLNEAIILANELKNKELLRNVYAGLNICFAMQNKPNEAYKYLELYRELNDSLTNSLYSDNLLELQTKYETAEKQKEIEKLQLEKQIQQAETEKERTQKIALMIVAILSILTALIIIRLRQRKQQLKGEEKERNRIARELHDGVAGSLANELIILENKRKTENQLLQIETLIGNIRNIYNEVRNLSHELKNTGQSVNLEQQIQNLLKSVPHINNIETNFVVYPKIDWRKIDKTLQKELFRIVQECMTNTQKHAQATEIEIQITKQDKNLNLIFDDNGKLDIDSNPERGTTINIDVPLKAVVQKMEV